MVWHIAGGGEEIEKGATWSVETRSPAGVGVWFKQAAPVEISPVVLGTVAPHCVCAAPLAKLAPGQAFDYRIVRDNKIVFAARANRARPTPVQPFKMVIFGDCAEDTASQKAYRLSNVAHQAGCRADYRRHRVSAWPRLRISRQLFSGLPVPGRRSQARRTASRVYVVRGRERKSRFGICESP